MADFAGVAGRRDVAAFAPVLALVDFVVFFAGERVDFFGVAALLGFFAAAARAGFAAAAFAVRAEAGFAALAVFAAAAFTVLVPAGFADLVVARFVGFFATALLARVAAPAVFDRAADAAGALVR